MLCMQGKDILLDFYPRPPRGGRLLPLDEFTEQLGISIHALREEGDDVYAGGQCDHPDFYPRPPRGGRRLTENRRSSSTAFLSTPSARRATSLGNMYYVATPEISIHALREEGDLRLRAHRTLRRYFYPRPPRGGRRSRYRLHHRPMQFLSTPSARRATC